MNLVASFKERAPKVAISIALLLAVIAPGAIVTNIFAAQVTERSIALSSSSAAATGVTYSVSFTAPSDASGGFNIDFCSNTPDPTESCTAPAGFSAAAVTTSTADYTAAVGSANNKVAVTHGISAGDTVTADLTNITNPSTAGPLYARVATFDTGATTTAVDQGSVAISITNTIGVSGAVLESLTFCVANAEITKDCANASSNAPVLKLGEQNGAVLALSSNAVSTGMLYTQVSTNAASGVVINLKSATDCGGLKRVGVTACDIVPVASLPGGTVEAGQARFGVKAGTAVGTTNDADAKGTIVPTGTYNTSTYQLGYKSDKTTGVTSAIGDPFLTTDGKPANNQNVPITFGVSVANDTPAGNYSTSLSMIATGKF